MKWRKETQVYMFAKYYSEDDTWVAWDKNEIVKGGSKKKFYNAKTHKMENMDSYHHYWLVQNLKTGEIFKEFKTLKEAKAFAENYAA